jgi:ribosomal protein L19
VSAPKPDIVRGLVISKVRRGVDSSFEAVNVEYGTPIIRTFRLYDPLVKDIKIIRKAHIHEGKKRVRRNKIYYYLNKDPGLFTI